MGGKHAELLVLCFTGSRQDEDGHVIYVANEAPVVGSGRTEEVAYLDMYAALTVYVRSLAERRELEDALNDRTIPHIRVRCGDSSAFDLRHICSKIQLDREPSATWLVPAPLTVYAEGQPGMVAMAHS